MGKFNWFKRKKDDKSTERIEWKPETKQPQIQQVKQESVQEKIEVELEEEKVNLKNPSDRRAYVAQNCEQIVEVTRQMEEFSKEYEAVTAYLSDIQVIDSLPAEPRSELDDTARNILMLTREREKYQNGKTKISMKQYKLMESYEDDIPNEVKKVNQKEAYQAALKKDLATLEGERHSLKCEQKEFIDRQVFLKMTSILVCMMTAAVLFVIGFLSLKMRFDGNNYIIATVVFALLCAAYIANEAAKNRAAVKLNQRKMQKAIGLMNRVKIKYVNNQLSLDYSYEKFNIKSSMQLTFFWEEYVKQKEINSKYKDNTEYLNFYSEKLVKLLRNYHLHDCDVWVNQSLALLEPKEMVEIRHRLNVRRQKLRDRMDYNNETKEKSIKRIREIVRSNPEAKEEIVNAMKKYQINL